MQGICTHIPETNYVPREHGVAAILLLLFMVLISLLSVLNLLYFYISTFRSMCAVPNMGTAHILLLLLLLLLFVGQLPQGFLFVLSFHSFGYVISYTTILSDLQFVLSLLHTGTSVYPLVQIGEGMTVVSHFLLPLL